MEGDAWFAIDHRNLAAANHVVGHQLVGTAGGRQKMRQRAVDQLLGASQCRVGIVELAPLRRRSSGADRAVVDRSD